MTSYSVFLMVIPTKWSRYFIRYKQKSWVQMSPGWSRPLKSYWPLNCEDFLENFRLEVHRDHLIERDLKILCVAHIDNSLQCAAVYRTIYCIVVIMIMFGCVVLRYFSIIVINWTTVCRKDIHPQVAFLDGSKMSSFQKIIKIVVALSSTVDIPFVFFIRRSFKIFLTLPRTVQLELENGKG